MNRTLIFAVLAAVSLLIPSCFPILGCPSSSKSRIVTTMNELELVKKEAYDAIMLTVSKVKDNDMNRNTGRGIITHLKEIIKHTDSLLTVCTNLKSVGKFEEILRFVELAGVSIQNEKKTLNCLNDLYDVSTHYQFETDTYFPAGEYSVLPDKRGEAQRSIGLIVQDIIKFLNNHPSQKFVAIIECHGYTDETLVMTESILHIRSRICSRGPITRQELNVKLSELRSKSIINLVVDQIKYSEEFIPNQKLVSYDIQWAGKGEELPYPNKIKDYKPEDKRRRLVNLTWHLLPGSLYDK